ncbi:hypothetical protein [Dokdonia sp. Asnod3-C12]|uniref:hypothetical protein n=1 Tax=Dokdonia sp. Asnod3-C12 TaxID=3160575 RepID=UPI00386F4C43
MCVPGVTPVKVVLLWNGPSSIANSYAEATSAPVTLITSTVYNPLLLKEDSTTTASKTGALSALSEKLSPSAPMVLHSWESRSPPF